MPVRRTSGLMYGLLLSLCKVEQSALMFVRYFSRILIVGVCNAHGSVSFRFGEALIY